MLESAFQYQALWNTLQQGLTRIPKSHTCNLPIWLDHFDSLWLAVSQAVPAATENKNNPEVSLYDHSKTTAALATALWAWHQANPNADINDWNDNKFLLIQGDFFGIQNFIFATGGETQKHAHKLLRGRSFQVGLLSDCAALKLLNALNLPSTSQIINAAGKFMVVAPNTPDVVAAITQVRQELNTWCLANTFGEIGVGIASVEASCNDFLSPDFAKLTKRLFSELEIVKLHQFDLCDASTPTVFDSFLDSFDNTYGVCQITGRYPAHPEASSRSNRKYNLSLLADDQIHIGEQLTKQARIVVSTKRSTLSSLNLDYFGFFLSFVPEQEETGKYGELVSNGTIMRMWDFSQPQADGSIWNGYARRFVNTYVPEFKTTDLQDASRYVQLPSDTIDKLETSNAIKTLSHLACEDRRKDSDGNWHGEVALMTLKGDIDNLGAIFQTGLASPTFAKMAAMSRQIHAFFALWLPWYCANGNIEGVKKFENTYTVFAGGDDFFLIGPWESTLLLAQKMREYFEKYVVNPNITFSIGMSMTKPKIPVRHLSHRAEIALEASKNSPNKNSATLWDKTVNWDTWIDLMQNKIQSLTGLMNDSKINNIPFSSSILYSLLEISQQANLNTPESAMWRSRLHYRLARFYLDRTYNDDNQKNQLYKLLSDAIIEIGGAIEKYKGGYCLPLSVLLYRQRD